MNRPGWLDSDRFDIEARPAAPVAYEICVQMVQSLLADRFGLRIHRETRQLPIFTLLVATNGHKLNKMPDDAPNGAEIMETNNGRIVTKGSTMAQLVSLLAMTGELENFVRDGTGLDGQYRFTLEWMPERLAAQGTVGPTLFTALQERLGLRLQTGRGPVNVVVIDRIDRVATEN